MNYKVSLIIFLLSIFSLRVHAAIDLSMVRLKTGELKPLEQLIEHNGLPGISVAVVDNYEIIFTYSGGLKDTKLKTKVSSETSFNAASISKPVVATLAVMLSEKGVLDLDAPVSNYLKSWTIPTSEFNKNQSITLRHLLTHTAGTSHSGYASNHSGDVIPTIAEILNSYKNEGITVTFEPGTSWKYSGGGYLIAQLAIEDVTGKTIAKLAADMIFTPLNMMHSTFYQDEHANFLSNVAKAHNSSGEVISTGIPICPQAACGLWTTASDMALFAIEIQKALAGQNTSVITDAVANQLMDIHTTELSGGWSIGWMRNLAVGNLDWFSHSGYNNGTGGLVMATVENGRGIFIFGNGSHRARVLTIDQIVESVVSAMNWKTQITPSKESISEKFINSVIGEYENITPHHFSPFARKVRIEKRSDGLVLVNSETANTQLPIVFIDKTKFMVNELVNSQLGIEVDENGVKYITMEHPDPKRSSRALRMLEND